VYILTFRGSNVCRASLERVLELYRKISGVDELDIERLIRRVKARDRVGDHASVEVGLATATSERKHACRDSHGGYSEGRSLQ
jgi:hypothetical protein